MSMCESILTIALVCTVKYLHYCDYYYTLGNDSQSTPKLIAYFDFADKKNHYLSKLRKVRSGRVYRSNRYRETGTTRQNNRQSEHKDKCRIMLQ